MRRSTAGDGASDGAGGSCSGDGGCCGGSSGSSSSSSGPGSEPHLRLIDFEYAAPNYAGYDIANCWCEHCGFLPFSLEGGFPTPAQQAHFAQEYLAGCGVCVPTAAWYRGGGAASGGAGAGSAAGDVTGSGDDAVSAAFVREFVARCLAFALASHLFWGLWAAIQAAGAEHEADFDYAAYAHARLGGCGWGKHRAELFPAAAGAPPAIVRAAAGAPRPLC